MADHEPPANLPSIQLAKRTALSLLGPSCLCTAPPDNPCQAEADQAVIGTTACRYQAAATPTTLDRKAHCSIPVVSKASQKNKTAAAPIEGHNALARIGL